MKNLSIAAAIAFSIAALVPTVSQAQTIPEGTIGVSEKFFAELQTKGCQGPQYSEPTACNFDYTRFLGHTIIRAESSGQLYIVRLQPDDSAEYESKVVMQRTLPNGIYKAKKRYYVVRDGLRYRLPKKRMYKKITSEVNSHPNSFVSPISTSDYELMLTTCEYYPSSDIDRGIYNECLKNFNTGQKIQQGLTGSIIMHVDTDGHLEYIDHTGRIHMIRRGQFKSLMKKNATRVPKKVITQLEKI